METFKNIEASVWQITSVGSGDVQQVKAAGQILGLGGGMCSMSAILLLNMHLCLYLKMDDSEKIIYWSD